MRSSERMRVISSSAVQRIVDEIVRAGHDRVLPHRAAAMRGQHDDRQELVARIGAQQAQRLRAVLHRHEQIEQHDVDAVAVDDLDRLARRSPRTRRRKPASGERWRRRGRD